MNDFCSIDLDSSKVKEFINSLTDLNMSEVRIKNLINLWRNKTRNYDGLPSKTEIVQLLSNKVIKIISGGQTGVDTIGLQVAKELGIETGGTAPKNFLRERGYDNEDISSYGLVEITDEEQADYTLRKHKSDPYTARTELNVRNSDGTVYFSTDKDSIGKIATARAAKEWNKPFLENPTVEELRSWITENNIKVLNVAGNRGTKLNPDNNIKEILKIALVDQDRKSVV